MVLFTLDRAPGAGRSLPRLGVNLGHALGNLGKSIVWTSFESFLLFYLVTFAGLSPWSIAALLAGLIMWDACADVIVGYLTDRYNRPDVLGRLVLIGAPLCGTAFWAMFAWPAKTGGAAFFVIIMVCRIGYTLCDIGHNTRLVRVATSARDASMVSGMRLVCNAFGAGLVGLAMSSALRPAAAADRYGALARYALFGAIVYGLTLLIAMLVTRGFQPAPGMSMNVGRHNLIGSIQPDRWFRRLLVLAAIQACLVTSLARALPFFGQAMYGQAAWSRPALGTMTLAQALSLPIWMWFSRNRPPTVSLKTSYGLIVLGSVLLLVPSRAMVSTIALAVVGIANGGSSMALWAILALAIRAGVAEGSSAGALPMGVFLATIKASAALGNLLISYAVALQHWGGNGGVPDWTPLIVVAVGGPILGCACNVWLVTESQKYFRSRD